MPGPTVRWLGAAVNRRKDAALRAGLSVAAAATLEASNARVPVESGALRASGAAGVTTHNGRPAAAVTYSAPYAAIVHERMDVHHPDGQPKFLETAVAEQPSESSPAVRAVAAALKQAL